MSLTITHNFVSSKSDGSDSSVVRPSNWNEVHVISGHVDETMFLFTDITTSNTSISKHGLVPKLPNDSTLFLNGVGNWVAAIGDGDVLSSGNNNFSGVNNFTNSSHFGETPGCSNALMTVYKTMAPETNTSMIDFIGTAGGIDNGTTLVCIITTNGDISNQLVSVYARTDFESGMIDQSATIFIDTPEANSTTVTNHYGLQINSQILIENIGVNLYSAGSGTQNLFDGTIGIGIGQNVALAPIHIAIDTGTGVQGTGLRINSVSGEPGNGAGVLWTNNNDVLQLGMISGQDDDNWGGRLAFFTSPQTNESPGGSLTERMRITSAGNVGIGNISPEAQLHVEYHATNAIAIQGEGYCNAFNGTGIGIKGIASVGSSEQATELASLVAGSPETDSSPVISAIGLKIENVTVGTFNWALKTGQGLVEINDITTIQSSFSDAIPLVVKANSSSQTSDLTRWLAPDTTLVASLSAKGSFRSITKQSFINTIDDSDTTTFDCSSGDIQVMTITANVNIFATNFVTGQKIIFILTQNGTGGWQPTWSDTFRGGKPINPTANSVSLQEFICLDGSHLLAVDAIESKALPGSPEKIQATGTTTAGEQILTFTSVVNGAAGNGVIIHLTDNFTLDHTQVTTVNFSSPPQITVLLQNTGAGSTATANDVIAAIQADNSGLVITSVASPGTGVVNAGDVTVTGGKDAIFTPIGGELWYDSEALWIGQSNGTFRQVLYS